MENILDNINKKKKIERKIEKLDTANRFLISTMTIFGALTVVALIGKFILVEEAELFKSFITLSLVPTVTSGTIFIPGVLLETKAIKKRDKLQEEFNSTSKEIEKNMYAEEIVNDFSKSNNYNNCLEHINYLEDEKVKVKVYKRNK